MRMTRLIGQSFPSLARRLVRVDRVVRRFTGPIAMTAVAARVAVAVTPVTAAATVAIAAVTAAAPIAVTVAAVTVAAVTGAAVTGLG